LVDVGLQVLISVGNEDSPLFLSDPSSSESHPMSFTERSARHADLLLLEMAGNPFGFLYSQESPPSDESEDEVGLTDSSFGPLCFVDRPFTETVADIAIPPSLALREMIFPQIETPPFIVHQKIPSDFVNPLNLLSTEFPPSQNGISSFADSLCLVPVIDLSFCYGNFFLGNAINVQSVVVSQTASNLRSVQPPIPIAAKPLIPAKKPKSPPLKKHPPSNPQKSRAIPDVKSRFQFHTNTTALRRSLPGWPTVPLGCRTWLL
jgi:hypothetical protein